MRTIPVVTIALTVVAGLASTASSSFDYQRDAIARGELWRIATCQFTHWSIDHLLWDAVVFVVIGSICERRDRPSFVAMVAIAAVVVPSAVHVACSSIIVFRGLSGIDSSLFALVVVRLAYDASGATDRGVAAVALVGFLAKTLVEQATGASIFAGGGFAVVPSSHLVGFAIGAATAIVHRAWEPRICISTEGRHANASLR